MPESPAPSPSRPYNLTDCVCGPENAHCPFCEQQDLKYGDYSDELLDRGCTCPGGHPPCSFCTDAFADEEEREIYNAEGASGVREHRSGVRMMRLLCEETDRKEAAAQTERMLTNTKYGAF